MRRTEATVPRKSPGAALTCIQSGRRRGPAEKGESLANNNLLLDVRDDPRGVYFSFGCVVTDVPSQALGAGATPRRLSPGPSLERTELSLERARSRDQVSGRKRGPPGHRGDKRGRAQRHALILCRRTAYDGTALAELHDLPLILGRLYRVSLRR